MAVLASIEKTKDGRILFLQRGSQVALPMSVGDERSVQNGRVVLRDTKKMGLHLATFGLEALEGKTKYEWVFHSSVKLDRPGYYHFAVKPDDSRIGYCGYGELYYVYRVRDPKEESDPIRRGVMETWNSCRRLKVNEVREWDMLDLPLYIRDSDRVDLPFGREVLLTDGCPRNIQYFKDYRRVMVVGGTYVVVVLEESNSDLCDHKMYRRGITRVYRTPDADMEKVLHAIESTNPKRYSNLSLF